MDDPVAMVRMQAVKGLWQFWFWSARRADEERDRGHAAGGARQSRSTRGCEQPAGCGLQPRRREHPLPVQQLGSAACASRRIASARSRAGSPWSRGCGKFAAVLESGSGEPEEGTASRADASSRCAAPMCTIWRPIWQSRAAGLQPHRQRHRADHVFRRVAPSGLRERLKPLLDSHDSEMRTLASRAVLLVRETRFADVNRLAGPPVRIPKSVMAKMETIPEATEVARSLKPPP